MSIEVEDDDGESIEITRTWHFRKNRQHRPGEDDLKIFHGIGRKPLTPPPSVDRDDWFRDWIAGRLLHPSLAEFFLFDGEQVQRYASREMGKQARLGIEGLPGLPILRSLKDSLAGYAQKRRASAVVPGDSTVKKIEADIAAISETIDEQRRRFNIAVVEAANLSDQVDREESASSVISRCWMKRM